MNRLEFFKSRIKAYQSDPVLFCTEVLSAQPDTWQINALTDLARSPKVSVRSGQGVGKTSVEAWALLWFLSCFPYARVVATAPTRQQLHDVLWAEVSKWQAKSVLLKHLLVWTKTRVALKTQEERWFAVARTATKPENMQGFHEENMLFIIDEASGVADPIMEAVLGTLSGENNKLLMCGNPTRNEGTEKTDTFSLNEEKRRFFSDKFMVIYITSGAVRDSAELVYNSFGMEFNFNKFDRATRDYLKDKTINWGKEVAANTERAVKRELVIGYEKGLGTYEVAENISRATGFSFSRAESIARTETLAACSYANYTADMANPDIIGHQWDATNDGRTRPTHKAANGQKRKKGEPFIVGGYKMHFPGDGSLGAPAGEIINCRCGLRPVFTGDGMDSHTVYDEPDMGLREWLLRQPEVFQAEYMGGKAKKTLFQRNMISIDDRQTPLDELVKTFVENTVTGVAGLKGINPSNVPVKDYKKAILPYILEVQLRGIHKDKEYGRVLNYADGKEADGKLKGVITHI